MTTSLSRASYEDCFLLLDRALESAHGIRQSCASSGAANHLRVRLNTARILSRQEATEIHRPDDPAFGISPYDTLVIRRPIHADGRWWVYIEPRKILGKVEELGAAE